MRFRVLVWALPEMLSGIIAKVLEYERDIDVVTHVRPELSLLQAVEAHLPCTVLTSTHSQSVEKGNVAVARILLAHPELKIVALEDDGRSALLYRLRLERVAIEEVSLDRLLDAIRKSNHGMGVSLHG